MKSQSLKLFAAAFVLGLVTIFASANPVYAQTVMSFETTFDFQVGKEKMTAGSYRLHRLEYGRYILRNSESNRAVIIATSAQTGTDKTSNAEYIIFNRYGENYFLRQIVDRRNSVTANELSESGYEAKIRKSGAESEENLARRDKKPNRISVNLNR